MSLSLDKAIDRVRKYLQLATSTNEHEAAQAAARAAALMEEYHLSEAMLRVEDTSRAAEKIVDGQLDNKTKKRVAWQAAIATAVAHSYGCKTWWHGANLNAFGRESATQAWNYTSQYLFRTVDELADKKWEEEKAEALSVGQTARVWKNAFRVGCAAIIATRLDAEAKKAKKERRAAVPTVSPEGIPGLSFPSSVEAAIPKNDRAELDEGQRNLALALIDRDEHEVENAYAEKSKNFRTTKAIGTVSCRSGYHAGREAGAGVALGGGRAGLPAGQGRLK